MKKIDIIMPESHKLTEIKPLINEIVVNCNMKLEDRNILIEL